MKKIVLFIHFILLSFCSLAMQSDDEIKFNRIINKMDSVFASKKIKDSILEDHFRFILNKIYSNEIEVKSDSILNYSFYSCATADISKNDSLKYHLAIGKYLIDIYDLFPELVYGILIHEFQHLYDFYTNRELIEISRQNNIEKIYFEVDALYIELLFFRIYTTKSDNRTQLEKYMSHESNQNLEGPTLLFLNVDLNLLHEIDAIKNKEISFEEGQKEYIKIGENLIKETKFTQDNWANYCAVTKLKTYTFFSRQVIHDLLYKLKGESVTDSQLNLKQYPEIADVIQRVQKIISENNKYFAYSGETLSMFDNEILNQIKK